MDVRPDGATLITGWEPELPVGDTLPRQFVLCYADRAHATAAVLPATEGAPVYRRPGFMPLSRRTMWRSGSAGPEGEHS